MARDPDQRLARGLATALDELYRRGYSQRDLAERFGVEPATVSRWKTGDRSFALPILPEIERLLGVRKGHVLRQAGYVDDPGDSDDPGDRFRDVVTADQSITEDDRRTLIGFYEFARSRSATAAK